MAKTLEIPKNSESAEKEASAPKPYGFEDAFDETGRSVEDMIQSGVTSTPPRINYEQSGKRVNSALKRFSVFSDHLFDAARASNARKSVGAPGREVSSTAMADAALPGTREYILMARRKVDAHIDAGFAGPNLQLNSDEEAFMEAMDWAALREQRLAAPQEINPSDYSSELFNPHGAPYDTYESAKDQALQNLLTEANQRLAAANTAHDTEAAADAQQTIDDLNTYRDTYMTVPPVNQVNRQAASIVGHELNASGTGTPNTPSAASLDAMKSQMNLDRVFTTYDAQLKGRMRAELDAMDQHVLGDLQNQVTENQDVLAIQSARNLRRMVPLRKGEVEGQADYDNASAFLGAMELRMAQRHGIPNPDGTFGTKLPRSGTQTDAFIMTNHIDRAKKLDAKILRELDEHRTMGDNVADFWAGQHNGKKEERKAVNFARRALKVGMFAALASTGPAGVAAGAALVKGSGKLAQYTSKHANELRTRSMDDVTDMRDLMAVMEEKNVPAIYKVFGTRREELSGRTGDTLSQQRRMQIAYGKAGLWAAGIGLAPVYAPAVAHIGLGIAENSIELAKLSGSRF